MNSLSYGEVWEKVIQGGEFRLSDFFENMVEFHLKKNPRLSKRSFAKKIDLSPSMLSLVTNGRRHLSEKQAEHIATKLEFSPSDREIFLLILKFSKARDARESEFFSQKLLETINRLRVDVRPAVEFSEIADWRYFALMHAMKASPSGCSEIDLERMLGLRADVLKLALAHLEKRSLIQRKDDGRYVSPGFRAVFNFDREDDELHRYFKSAHRLSESYLDKRVDNESFVGSVQIAFTQSALTEARKILDTAIVQLRVLSSKATHHDSVYQYFYHFFPLRDDGEESNVSPTSGP